MTVNIVHPIDGATYPKADILPTNRTVKSAYITASFGATCKGGPHDVSWGFDSTTIGKGTYYDQISAQPIYKLDSGKHRFWVKSDCGADKVLFIIK
jgi:hypothetical protein